MLAFITSIRHPYNSANYARVESLLAETLASVTNQTSNDYVVIVVGNRAPSFPLPDKVHFVKVDFEAPIAENGPHTGRSPFIIDKGTKIGVGLIYARDFEPDYVMIFDADDFVHRDLAAFVSRHPHSAGWFISRGWVYSRARCVYRDQPDFHRECGTSFIVPFEAYGVPSKLNTSASQNEIVASFGDRLTHIIGAHRDALSWYASNGRDLEPLPFRGAVYHVDTGENHSGRQIGGIARPHDRKLEIEFGIHRHRSALVSYWNALGPISLVRTLLYAIRRLAKRASYWSDRNVRAQ